LPDLSRLEITAIVRVEHASCSEHPSRSAGKGASSSRINRSIALSFRRCTLAESRQVRALSGRKAVLTRALTVVEQAKVDAAEWERDREAWNLPRRPAGTNSHDSRELANEITESEPLEAWANEGGAELRLST